MNVIIIWNKKKKRGSGRNFIQRILLISIMIFLYKKINGLNLAFLLISRSENKRKQKAKAKNTYLIQTDVLL